MTRARVAGSPASCQVVEARQETETDWGGVRLHHVCWLCSPAGREGGEEASPTITRQPSSQHRWSLLSSSFGLRSANYDCSLPATASSHG